MPEANGGSEYLTGVPRVDAARKRLRERNDARFKDLEDAMLVQVHLEKRMSERIKEHAAFIARHELFIARHELMMSEFDDKLGGVIGSLDQFRQALAEFGKRG